jgi:hypothetical protein
MSEDDEYGRDEEPDFLQVHMKLDQLIGSMLENWLTKDCPKGYCRFCRKPVDGRLRPEVQFCDGKCKANFDKVQEARIVIGKRDLERRGYD